MAFSRRRFAALGALGVSALSLRSGLSARSDHEGLRSRYLMDLELDTAEPQVLGSRQIVPITGGTFEGPRLSGVALEGGGDWLVRRPDGLNELNVRATLRTDDAALINVWYRGLLFTPQGGDTYWRTTPVFETAAEPYTWLNQVIAVGVGHRAPGTTSYRIYEIL